VGNAIPMPPLSRVRSDNIEMDEVAWAKLRIAKIVWNMPTEEALGILADTAVRLLRRTYDGETAMQAGKIFCSEVANALERATFIQPDEE
jgi:hypothetical protein